jgi:hypothetical protein
MQTNRVDHPYQLFFQLAFCLILISGCGPSTSGTLIEDSQDLSSTDPLPTPDPTPDSAAPSTVMTAPASGVWTGNSIVVSATASDDVSLARLEIWGAGQIVASVECSETPCTLESTWITGALTGVAFEVQSVAIDQAGNRTVSLPIYINKAGTSPIDPSGANPVEEP